MSDRKPRNGAFAAAKFEGDRTCLVDNDCEARLIFR